MDCPFENMKNILNGGGVRAVSAPQLFATPHTLAARMVELADILPSHRVLEPSAGTGHILKAIGNAPDKVAVEINWTLCDGLARLGLSGLHIVHDDFLTCTDLGLFDRVVMNPPFENGADIKHIKHALTMLKDGGILVALCANGSRQNRTLKPLAEESGGFYEPLPAGTFKEAGTMVNAALMVIYK